MFAHLRHVDGRTHLGAWAGVVERAGDQTRRCRLAHPAHAGEHVGLRNPAAGERIGERAHHRVLAEKIGKCLRPVFASQDPIAGGVGRNRTFRRARWDVCQVQLIWMEWEVGQATRANLVRAASFRT